MAKFNEQLNRKVKNLPKTYGVYVYLDQFNNVLYVGKAVNLFNRVSSYNKDHHDFKTDQLTKQIVDLQYYVVNNENEALILENNLIKKYQPKFNIVLKSDNQYPYFLLKKPVKNDEYPSLVYTHRYNPKLGTYYGPIAKKGIYKYDLYNLLLSILPFKRKDWLSNAKVDESLLTYKVSIYNENEISSYLDFKRVLDEIFKGNFKDIIRLLTLKEKNAAAKLDFENAFLFQKQKKALTGFFTSSSVQLDTNKSFDIVVFLNKEEALLMIIFNYVKGKLLGKQVSFQFDVSSIDLPEYQVSFILQYYLNNKKPKTLFLYIDEEHRSFLERQLGIKVNIPTTYKQKKIMENGINEASLIYIEKLKTMKIKETMMTKGYQELKDILHFNELKNIEVYDNSNLNLINNVCCVICYTNGIFTRENTRFYNLLNYAGAYDGSFFYDVVKKRFKFLTRKDIEDTLIILDGGMPQISCVLKAFSELDLKARVIGLVKDEKHTTDRLMFDDGRDIILDRKSNLYKFLCGMQEKVHNLALARFNKKVSKNLKTYLDGIPGIGRKTIDKLLKVYPSKESFLNAEINEVLQLIRKNQYFSIKEHLSNQI
ncbi:excinuclease ABC subunit UvrC [Ureaplasma canigenitalium]|uniref:excinuclease ABC subunit UvrC n=1 Tax=Ureaplasma canigenitalium TaxID=42092 RepID=UPI0004E275B3|nr:excinuclease ABC subunit UvrC [Ureaplasma canigenitalium]